MNKEFLPVLPIIIFGIVMVIWGEKLTKWNLKFVKSIYDVCFWGCISGLIVPLISLILIVIFPESTFIKWLFGNVAPVICAAGFAMLGVRYSIYFRLPEEMQD